MKPGEESFDLPAAPRAARGAAVLGRDAAAAAVPGDHFDPIVLQELRIEGIAVVPAITDQSCGEVGEETEIERRWDEVRLIR